MSGSSSEEDIKLSTSSREDGSLKSEKHEWKIGPDKDPSLNINGNPTVSVSGTTGINGGYMNSENTKTKKGRYKLTRAEKFSLMLIIMLQFVSTALTNMLIPIYGVITEYYRIDQSFQGIPDAVFILVSAGLSVVWGYYTDRINRARVIMIGAFIGMLGAVITAFDTIRSPEGFGLLIFARALTGFGMGCVLPIGYSILGDLIPAEERSGWFGTLAILNSVFNGTGQGLSAFIGPLNILGMGWRFPFMLMAAIGAVIILILFFVNIPTRGSHEEELSSISEFQLEYLYRLSKKDIIKILKKKTNLHIFIQGFLAIIPGTLVVYFLTTMFNSSDGVLRSVDTSIRTQVSSIMAGLVGIGYMVGNSALAALGDYLFRKNKANRVILSGVSLLIAAPMGVIFVIIAGFLDPGNAVPPGASFIEAFGIIFMQHPVEFTLYFIFAFIASFFSAAPVANRGAVMVDVNLPEHRGTTVSFFNLAEQLGKGITLLMSYPLLMYFGNTVTVLNPYQSMIIFASIFWIPAGLIWIHARKCVIEDMREKSMVLIERNQQTIIDYIFELQIQLDTAVHMVHEARKLLGKDNRSALKILRDVLRRLDNIVERAKADDMADVISRAVDIRNNVRIITEDLENLIGAAEHGEPDGADVNSLKTKILELIEPSDFGNIEILYDTAYLKFIEAMLIRDYSLFGALRRIDNAIETVKRVELLAKEGNIVDDDSIKIEPFEKELIQKRKKLAEKAANTAAVMSELKEKLGAVIDRIISVTGLSRKDLVEIMDKAAVIKVPFYNLIVDRVKNPEIEKSLAEIREEVDRLFAVYDRWQTQFYEKDEINERKFQ